MSSCGESTLRMTVESVQGIQVYLEWTGTLGPFGILARPLEFLSTFKRRVSPLEMRQIPGWIPVPKKLGKGPTSRDKEGKTGLFLSCGRTLGISLEWRQVSLGTS